MIVRAGHCGSIGMFRFFLAPSGGPQGPIQQGMVEKTLRCSNFSATGGKILGYDFLRWHFARFSRVERIPFLKCLYIFCRLANVNFRLKIAKIFFPDFLPRRNAFNFVFCIFH
jgi:hypothetical protein